jgi:hypothetical protein
MISDNVDSMQQLLLIMGRGFVTRYPQTKIGASLLLDLNARVEKLCSRDLEDKRFASIKYLICSHLVPHSLVASVSHHGHRHKE